MQSDRSHKNEVKSKHPGDVTGQRNNIEAHLNRMSLQDFTIDERFLDTLDPAMQTKLKMITSAYEKAKEHFDDMINWQKQYMKDMGEQSMAYQTKLDSFKLELKQEQAMKDKAEKDVQLWKDECQKYQATFHKMMANKKHIQSNLAQMYDKYAFESHSPTLSEKESSSLVEDRWKHQSVQEPAAMARPTSAETRSQSVVRLPPISKPSSIPRRTGRPRHSLLPHLDEKRN